MQKGECKLISKTKRGDGFDVVYEAGLYTGTTYKKQRCEDYFYKHKGIWKLADTASSVTYYELLMKQLKK